MSIIRTILMAIILLLPLASLQAQEEDILGYNDLFDNKEELEALALYPDDIRESILELCLHPELIVRLGAIQTKTQAAFQDIIQDEPEEVQKNYWELLRYPGLVKDIVSGGPKSEMDMNDVLAEYPEEIHAVAMDYGRSRYMTLEQINSIDQSAEKSLDLLLTKYDPITVKNVNHLLKYPEVLHIMAENIDVALLVGEEYQKDPEGVIAKAEELKLEVAKKHQKDIEDWKKGLEEDPQALREFEEASKDFKGENEEYLDDDPLYPKSLRSEDEVVTTEEDIEAEQAIEHHYYPYPFWYGYPAWFPHVYWYRYPYWYHWGFYYGPERTMIILGLPSYYYFYWYFDYPNHYYRYPYLSDYIIRYYRARRVSGPRASSLTRSVDYWRGSSRSRIPNSILEENDARVRREKLREYGRFEEDYRRHVQRRPANAGTREEYLNRNNNRYRYLSGETRTVKPNNQRTPITNTPFNIRISKQSRILDLNRARETHQRTWQGSNYSRSRTAAPAPRSKKSTGVRKRKRDN